MVITNCAISYRQMGVNGNSPFCHWNSLRFMYSNSAKDFKRLIAYSSIAHVGLISAGILSANQQGVQGAIMQMLAHGVNVVGLFFIADILLRHTGTNEINKLGVFEI